MEPTEEYYDWDIFISPIKELTERKDIANLLQEYSVYSQEKVTATTKKDENDDTLGKKEEARAKLKEEIKDLEEKKAKYNQNFYKKYSRFIQEGTW
jgi:predicted  nucleic acid-binding Zn-ribbon protein